MNIHRLVKYNKYTYIPIQSRHAMAKHDIDYLNTIKIPKSYTDVSLSTNQKAKVIGTGKDKTGKVQYFYSKEWIKKTSKKKYCALAEFGRALPTIISSIKKNISGGDGKRIYYISVILRIIMFCHFRIGNRKNVNDGITDISLKNVSIRNNVVKISFIGKKAQLNECLVSDPNLRRIIKHMYKNVQSRKNFFSFKGVDGAVHHVSSSDVNNYLKTFGPFTAKMFRTWNANILYLNYIRSYYTQTPESDLGKLSRAAIKHTSEQLYNTQSICKKNYLISTLIEDISTNNINIKRLFGHKATKIETVVIKYLESKC